MEAIYYFNDELEEVIMYVLNEFPLDYIVWIQINV